MTLQPISNIIGGARGWTRPIRAAVAIGFVFASVGAFAASGDGGPGINATAPAKAQVAPATNTSVTNARVLVPDGTSVFQAIGAGETRWFAFEVEPGRSYVVEAIDPNGDLSSSAAVGTLSVVAADGFSIPPDTVIDCAAGVSDLPPGLNVANNGKRCTVYVNAPDDTTLNRRGVFVSIGQGTGTGVNVRVRDSTLYGRWTTNGYDFHLEVQNTTSSDVCVQALFYRNSGYAFSGTDWGDAPTNLNQFNIIVPANGANKIVVPDGTLVGATSRGVLRLLACPAPGASNFVPGSVHVSSYAFNPVTHVYLFFYTWQSHNGSGANSW